MANVNSGFFETLVAAVDEFNSSLMGQVALLGNVYQDVRPEVARIGHQINIPFPDLGEFTDQGVGDWTTSDVDSSNFKSITFTVRPGKAILIRDFEQYQTQFQLIEQYIRPMYQRAQEYLNAQIAALVTPANFPSFAPIIGTTQGEVTVTDTLAAWENLAGAKVPMNNEQDLALLVHPAVYRKMLGDAQYNQESIVSAMIAQQTRQEGQIPNTFRFRPQWDQQMPTASATILHGTAQVTNGSTAVTGWATSWTADLATGNSVVFGNDATKTAYTVTVVNDTTLTLGAVYAGATAVTTVKKITVLAGTASVTSGAAAVTGVGTAFDTALAPGDWVTFATDATGTPYQVQSIASATALTLASNATATFSAKALTKLSFPCLAMHRYAIGVALRNLPSPEAMGLPFPGKWAYVNLGGILARMMMSYQHKSAGVLLSFDFGYGLGVLRPTFGQIIKV